MGYECSRPSPPLLPWRRVLCFPAVDVAGSIRRAAWIFPVPCDFRGWHPDRRPVPYRNVFFRHWRAPFRVSRQATLDLLATYSFALDSFLKPVISSRLPSGQVAATNQSSSPLWRTWRIGVLIHGSSLLCNCRPFVPVGRVLLARPGPACLCVRSPPDFFWPSLYFSAFLAPTRGFVPPAIFNSHGIPANALHRFVVPRDTSVAH